MTHRFIINTENVNTYGYRILTAGIDYEQYMRNPVVLFMHERDGYEQRGSEVIGRCVSLKQIGSELVAEIEFDKEDEFANKIAGKIERGYIRMASMSADVLASSSDASDVLPGQKYETVTQCKLIEISIVDIGGNNDALKLSKGIKLTQLKLLNQNKNNMSFKTIALALGKPADASEEALLNTISELKLAKQNSDANVKEWKDKYIALQQSEAKNMVAEAVRLGLLNEHLTDGVLLAFEKDYEGEKAKLSKLIEDKQAENATKQTQGTIGNAVQLGITSAPSGNSDGKDTYDYLQKHNPVELRRIYDEEPEKYAQLAADYGKGVRFVK